MRNMKKSTTPKRVRTSHLASPWIGTLILLVVWLLLPCTASAKSGKDGRLESAQSDYGRIEGKWLRLDSGYVLELSDIKPEGKLNGEHLLILENGHHNV